MGLLIPVGGFALGLLVGRWWIVSAALPFWATVVYLSELGGSITAWIATVLAVLLAGAIWSGVALRRLHGRRRTRRALETGL